jgi:hypothetical protein
MGASVVGKAHRTSVDYQNQRPFPKTFFYDCKIATNIKTQKPSPKRFFYDSKLPKFTSTCIPFAPSIWPSTASCLLRKSRFATFFPIAC